MKVKMGAPAWRNATEVHVKHCFPDETEVFLDGPVMQGTAGTVRDIKVGGCTP